MQNKCFYIINQTFSYNAGFISVSDFAEKFSIIGSFQNKFKGIVGKGLVNNVETLVLQPLTFMNLSGEAVIAVMNFYKIPIENILVIYDDISLALGVLRFRASGSFGGHNGIKSIIQHLGTEQFSRLKIGIGPQPQFMPSESFVLQKFSQEEMDALKKIVHKTTDSIQYWVQNGTDKTIPKFNGKTL